ncbi:MAG: NHL repeat-containing protein, partial [Firmicutes bacterium]|nr:NHL repeat-containing protein [Bacillota bacterium]
NLGNHDVLAFLPNGRLIAAFGGYGESSGQLIGPTGIAVALDGTVYVADADRQQVLAFSPTGRPLRAWGSWGSQPGQFDGLSAVAVGPQGTVYVADTLNNRVEAYTSDGTLVGVAITPDPVALGDAGEGQVTVTDGLTGASATVSLTAATAGS